MPRRGIPFGLSIQQEYEVEKIIRSRFDCSLHTYVYNVQWKGYPESFNTWEPVWNLGNAKLILEEFLAKQRKKQEKVEKEEQDEIGGDHSEDENYSPCKVKKTISKKKQTPAPKPVVPAASTSTVTPTNKTMPVSPQTKNKCSSEKEQSQIISRKKAKLQRTKVVSLEIQHALENDSSPDIPFPVSLAKMEDDDDDFIKLKRKDIIKLEVIKETTIENYMNNKIQIEEAAENQPQERKHELATQSNNGGHLGYFECKEELIQNEYESTNISPALFVNDVEKTDDHQNTSQMGESLERKQEQGIKPTSTLTPTASDKDIDNSNGNINDTNNIISPEQTEGTQTQRKKLVRNRRNPAKSDESTILSASTSTQQDRRIQKTSSRNRKIQKPSPKQKQKSCSSLVSSCKQEQEEEGVEQEQEEPIQKVDEEEQGNFLSKNKPKYAIRKLEKDGKGSWQFCIQEQRNVSFQNYTKTIDETLQLINPKVVVSYLLRFIN